MHRQTQTGARGHFDQSQRESPLVHLAKQRVENPRQRREIFGDVDPFDSRRNRERSRRQDDDALTSLRFDLRSRWNLGPRQQHHPGSGRVMGRMHSRGANARRCPDRDRLAEDRIQCFPGDGPGSQDGWTSRGGIHDGGLDSDRARSSIEDPIHLAVQIGDDVLGGGGADPPESVRGRRGNAPAEGVQKLLSQGASRNAQCDGRLSPGDEIECSRAPGDDQRERAGPESLGQSKRILGKLGRPVARAGEVGDVDDQRM